LAILLIKTEKLLRNNFIVILKVAAVIFVIIAGLFLCMNNSIYPDVQTFIVDENRIRWIGGIVSGAAAISLLM
jgi:APA family basic amino acid/polyamine antiporter